MARVKVTMHGQAGAPVLAGQQFLLASRAAVGHLLGSTQSTAASFACNVASHTLKTSLLGRQKTGIAAAPSLC